MVSSLINHDLQVWRRDFILAKFNREEGEAICDILLSRRQERMSVFFYLSVLTFESMVE
ncbi:hypothetical protein SO802_030169 [Lithocarpus litseifolius]|uniref:Uncharacterized protein n=1 Tax=Lithocarpus litseifolius TaxID=425828 RepID=A0AAW2BV95_9ROSI